MLQSTRRIAGKGAILLLLASANLRCGGGETGTAGEDGDVYPPKVVLSLWEEEPLTPPCTHHIDVEIQSFDPAEGYLELWVGGRVLRRVLDPPPAEVYPVYNSVYSCQPPTPSCPGSYTAKLFLFSSPEPVAESTIAWRLLPGASVPVEVAAEATLKGAASDVVALPPDAARNMWPVSNLASLRACVLNMKLHVCLL